MRKSLLVALVLTRAALAQPLPQPSPAQPGTPSPAAPASSASPAPTHNSEGAAPAVSKPGRIVPAPGPNEQVPALPRPEPTTTATPYVPPASPPARVPLKPQPYHPQKLVLPPPPVLTPETDTGKGRPFDPDATREVAPQPDIQLPVAPAVPATPKGALSVQDAVKLAWQLQPDVRVARASLLQAEGTTQETRSRLLPTLSVQSQYTHRSTTTDGGIATNGLPTTLINTVDTFSNTLGLNQLIFDFGHTRTLVRESDLRQQAAAAKVLQTENDIALTVKEDYFAVTQAERLLKVAQDDLTNRQEQLRLARALYQAGNMSPGDVVRAQTSVSNSVFSLNNARRSLQVARQNLAQILGLPARTELQLSDRGEPDVPNRDMESLSKSAAEKRPDLLVAQKNVDAGIAGVAAAHTTNYPALTGFAGVTYLGATNGVQYPAVTLQLALGFDIYDGGFRDGAVKIAEGVLAASRAELSRTELAVEREVSGEVLELLTAERNVVAAKAAVDSAKEGIRIAKGRYQAALGTLTDVFDTQSALVAAQTNLVNSYTDLSLARARLRHSLAAPFEENYGAGEQPLEP